METAKIMNTIELQKMVDKLCTEKDAAVHSAANFIKENIKQRQEILKLTARIAKLEELVERLIELGDVINGDKDSVWTLQTIKECWTEDVTKWKEREDSE